MPLSDLLPGSGTGVKGRAGGKRVGDYLLSAPKRRKERLRPFEFNAEELEELAVARRAYTSAEPQTIQINKSDATHEEKVL